MARTWVIVACTLVSPLCYASHQILHSTFSIQVNNVACVHRNEQNMDRKKKTYLLSNKNTFSIVCLRFCPSAVLLLAIAPGVESTTKTGDVLLDVIVTVLQPYYR